MSAQTISGPEVDELLDVGVFAERVLGRPLWPHQLELARHPARYRVVCAGRQVGKSVLLATLALHTAATRRNALVLLVSAGEVASRRLLADCADVATGSALLGGSVLDEGAQQLTLSNGSRILSVPASQRQIRGWPVDLLIVDEAGFVGDDVWRAAEPAIVARPGSRVVLSSSPWGGPQGFFRSLWQRGTDHPDENVASWHWPSTVSPLVDAALLEQIRQRETVEYFEREFLALWTDESGSFFTEAELTAAVADYALSDPTRTPPCDWPVVGGLDWGQARDANALVLLAAMDPRSCSDGRWRLFVPWLEAVHSAPWSDWIDRVIATSASFRTVVLASETNGVGSYPTEDLGHRMYEACRGVRSMTFVVPVWTDVRRKQSGFGKIKTLLQAGRLVLPRHPELLKQLRALRFEQLPAGAVRIAVPDAAGHDDLAMALLQAMSAVETGVLRDDRPGLGADTPSVATGAGVLVPAEPRVLQRLSWCRRPAGAEGGEGW